MNHSLSFSYQLAIVLVMVVIGAIAGIYLPWYALGILFGLLAYILRIPTGRAFILGLVSGFLVWAISAYWMDGQHPSSLPGRMANLFPLGGSVIGLYAVTGVLGGLTGGLWAWAGAKLRFK
ncbi:MAG: hypothetical protein HQ448_10645 [Cytophagales bacterium]|nr:hypothetical protein [Cytophagales bacterium]